MLETFNPPERCGHPAHPGRPQRSTGPGLAMLLLGALLTAPSAATGAPDAAEGRRIMEDPLRGNCLACHSLPGQRGIASNFAPGLAGVATRHDAQRLRQWVTDARAIRPDTAMPPFGSLAGTVLPARAQPILSPEEIEHVLAALAELR